jgi:predicted MFS family arabinose efflux permease
VVLVLYLTQRGLTTSQSGLLLTCILAGDILVSLFLTTRADRLGRRRMLVIGAGLMVAAGVVFAVTGNFWLLIVAGTIGVISPSGGEVGPFLSIEQASLSHVLPDRARTSVFAWYTLAGSVATATGSLAGGFLSQATQSYRVVVILYALTGVLLGVLFTRVSPAVEVALPGDKPGALGGSFGLSHSRKVVLGLSGLFALDSFAGGFVVQSFVAYWFYQRFGVNLEGLGAIFFGANVLAGISALVASRMAARFGLVRTMVFTHLPSNVLLILVPLMPTLPLAVLLLFLRFSISQMDVPTRQSYVMAVVRPDERSAAAGITGVARTTGAALAPAVAGLLYATPSLSSWPFIVSGGLKIVYDLLLYRSFVKVQPPEELTPGASRGSSKG